MSIADELLGAREPGAIISTLARFTWAKDDHKETCPANRIPDEDDLTGELKRNGHRGVVVFDAESPKRPWVAMPWEGIPPLVYLLRTPRDGAPTEAALRRDLLNETDPPYEESPDGEALLDGALGANPDQARWTTPQDPEPAAEIGRWDRLPPIEYRLVSLREVHAVWCDLKAPRPTHPLTPLIRAWWRNNAPIVDPDRRRHGILSKDFATRGVVAPDQPTRLPDLPPPISPGPVKDPDGAFLPGLEPTGKQGIPALLQLYDLASGYKIMRGGADLPFAIFVEALLSVKPSDRGAVHRIRPLTIGEIAGDWLQWQRRDYRVNKDRNGGALQKALGKINSLTVPLGNRGGWYLPVIVHGVEGFEWNDRVAFEVRLPSSASVGPPIDRAVLRYLRKYSTPAYRAYLSLCFDWDHYGGHRGRLALETRPTVMRNEAGYVLDARGDIVTERGGAPVTSPFHRRAVRTGEREPNPDRKRYPVYGADDLVRLCYPAADSFETAVARRNARRAAKDAILKWLVEKTGVASIESLSPRSQPGRAPEPPWRIIPRHYDWKGPIGAQ